MSSNSTFESTGELVAGTLRGYRSWILAERPTGRMRHIVRQASWEDFYSDLGTIGRIVPMASMIRSEPVPETEIVLRAVSWPVFWGGQQVHGGYCLAKAANFEEAERGSFGHKIPMSGCSCGIYGWYTDGDALIEHTGPVVGVVEVSGKLLLGTRGFRAERAKIIAVTVHPDFVTPGLLGDLHTALNTKRYKGIKLLPSLAELQDMYPPDVGTLSNLGINVGELESDRDFQRQIWQHLATTGLRSRGSWFAKHMPTVLKESDSGRYLELRSY